MANVNDTLDEGETNESVLPGESFLTPAYCAYILLPDSEYNSSVKSLNLKQHELFDIVQSWAKQYV